MQNEKSSYYIGLDVGTDSAGYAVTDERYNLLKYRGEPMWGVHLFEEAQLNEDRRAFRTARRRLDRRQQRIRLLQELFATEIAKVDEKFFIRIRESFLYPEDTTSGAMLFCDPDFNDSDYYKQYPTIHHLISELIRNREPHDVRLVYLACAWLVAHRGHFLNEIAKENAGDVLNIQKVYHDLIAYFETEQPWQCDNLSAFGDILKQKGVNQKYKALSMLLYNSPKAPKADPDNAEFPYSREAMLKMLCGGTVAPAELFGNEAYKEIESFTLDKGDDELDPILSALGDDAELIVRLKAVFDWAVLSDVLQGEKYISNAKVKTYEQHEIDLRNLKRLVRTYAPQKYNEMFRLQDGKTVNYAAYAKGSGSKQEDFCKYVKSVLKNVSPCAEDEATLADVRQRAEEITLCPKQVNGDNRVIPYQVYWVELKAVLDNASAYLPFLNETEDGISVAEKILSIFEFRVPYFVGPLNQASSHAWLKRKAEGRVYPWNLSEKVDLEASEQAFIDRMTNACTYLPDADVLPKNSLCYEKYQLLNELNPLSVNGRRISVELKQAIFHDLCLKPGKLTRKAIQKYLQNHNHYTSEELETLSGVDDAIKSSLSSYRIFRNLLESGKLTEDDAEKIIERRTYTESKPRFVAWLAKEYASLSDEDRAYIGRQKFNDFGRLSRRLLCDLYGTETNSETGEAKSILQRMWDENVTLMEILSERYTYAAQIEQIRKAYFDSHPKSLSERLDDMYVSNSVKRPIIRALELVSDVVKAQGRPPEKIFVEMARGGKPEEKGKRTQSRYNQIKALYEKCDSEDAPQLMQELEAMGEAAESRLQGDKLFLYYIQLGRCMYTGERIDLSQLASKLYDVDHIYPQSKVKDDSVLNNKVLVLSTVNGEKSDQYPLQPEIRRKQFGWWRFLKENGFISEEKYKRLTRSEPFSETEEWGFINRQLVETRQSTKALATLLGEFYPQTRIVYVKAGLVSEFRQEFDLLKSRSVNDLHHAKDAYLNIVVGNVYNERFTRQWFLENRDTYNLKVKTLFGEKNPKPVLDAKGNLLWNGSEDIGRIKNIVQKKNAIHLTRYAFDRHGGFFDQQPVAAAEGLVPRKKGLPTEKYGGYNRPTASFFMLAQYRVGKKSDLMLVPIELLFANQVAADAAYAETYVKEQIGKILKKEVASVSFPLGLRKIKIGTVFEFDGCFRAYITGKAGGGTRLGFSAFCPLVVGYEREKYVKRLERLSEKKKENPNMVYSEKYDEVTVRQNLELYDFLTAKLCAPIYKKRPNNPSATLEKGRAKFEELSVFEQTYVLIQILVTFSRINQGIDLLLIGGSKHEAHILLSSSLSNWKKNYADVRIVDMNASGLHESKTQNLLELL